MAEAVESQGFPFLAKCRMVHEGVLGRLKAMIPGRLRPYVSEEGQRWLEKCCDLCHQYLIENGEMRGAIQTLTKIKIKFKINPIFCLPPYHFEDDIAVVLKSFDYSRRGKTFLVTHEGFSSPLGDQLLIPFTELKYHLKPVYSRMISNDQTKTLADFERLLDSATDELQHGHTRPLEEDADDDFIPM
eukprot:NODE_5319_length_670_cov_24.191529_g5156_i0.p1 GENE.NODE_5319_length_670_cov_24.191529_g5156_i0~~NODE_5319_length_670_cov_24.191529_g5156_i0.p1  ORF type:complete len:187 (-),score=47.83 NODE_5319_length_670_cov_24.191529_g5156_i0:43-603(-)